jgi:hypothetical protein
LALNYLIGCLVGYLKDFEVIAIIMKMQSKVKAIVVEQSMQVELVLPR